MTANGMHKESDPVKAKQRLVKDGVDFTNRDGETEIPQKHCLTYYVVTLVFEVQGSSHLT